MSGLTGWFCAANIQDDANDSEQFAELAIFVAERAQAVVKSFFEGVNCCIGLKFRFWQTEN
jgi:hypothetical protein